MKKPTKRKRISKAARALAEAGRLAGLLADAPPAHAGALAPPAFITDPRLAAAHRFWKDHAEQLRDLGTLERLDRFTFAMFCVYVADFIAAEDDILATGYSVMVKTVSGDKMPRENPSVARRDGAAKMILEMSRLFGLSKIDRLNLSKLARGSELEGTLFGVPAPDRSAPATDKPTDSDKEWGELMVRRPN
jgi:phage terminase small subunit